MGIPVEVTVRSEVLRRRQGNLDAGSGDDAPRNAEWDEGFAALAGRNAGFMYRVAYGLLRNPQDAEDAVQEALLKLYRTGAWRGIEDERAFLARTVWRAGLDVAARRAKNTRQTEPFDESAGYETDGVSAEMAMIEGDARELLRKLIDALPEELRQPLVLSAIDEMTSREVGAALGLPEATVRTRVARARAELRRRYQAMELRTVRGGAR